MGRFELVEDMVKLGGSRVLLESRVAMYGIRTEGRQAGEKTPSTHSQYNIILPEQA